VGHAIKKGLRSVKFSALNIQRGLKQGPTLPYFENLNPEREMPTVRDTVCVPIFDTVGQYGDVTGYVRAQVREGTIDFLFDYVPKSLMSPNLVVKWDVI